MATVKGEDRGSPILPDNSSGSSPHEKDVGEKGLQSSPEDVELVNGHLAELEVDISRVLTKTEEEGDYDADTSPYPTVRGVVPETDDPGMPVNTFRAVSPLSLALDTNGFF